MMILKNYEIEKFGVFLYGLGLKGKQSRMRTRFVKILNDHLMLMNEERQQLLEDYAKKDEQGEYVKEEHEGQQVFILDDAEGYNLEMMKLMKEEFIYEETQERLDMLLEIKEVVLNCDVEFSGNEAILYDKWCEAVEDIN